MGTHRPETGVSRRGRMLETPRRNAGNSSRPPRFAPCSYLPRMFHGPAVVRGTPQEPRRSTADRVTNTLSLCEWLLGSRRLKQKRKLFPGPPPMDASWFPLPGSCTKGQPVRARPRLASRPGYGISTVFPFATNSQPATEENLTFSRLRPRQRRRRRRERAALATLFLVPFSPIPASLTRLAVASSVG